MKAMATLAALALALGSGCMARAQEGNFPAAPKLVGGPWVNGKPVDLAALKGKVVVLTFWTFQCINCERALPFWNKWAQRFVGKDVVLVSVHTPEVESERNVRAVEAYAKKQKLAFPILIDNDFKNWNAYNVRYWPTTLLIDKRGRLRGVWEGELDYNGSGEWRRAEAGIDLLRKE